MKLGIIQQVLGLVFILAAILGAVANKTNFCTMGAVSDWVNMGDTGRLRAWLLAITIAMIGVLILSATGVDFNSSFPPYLTANFSWARYIVGGILFGIGMTLGSGCGYRTVVRIGAGNLKSVFVIVPMAIMAYLMTKTNFYYFVFGKYLVTPTTVALNDHGISNQGVNSLLAGLLGLKNSAALHLLVGGAIALILLYTIFKSREFRTNFDNVLAGVVVGLVVVGGWYVTGGPLGHHWQNHVAFMDTPPNDVAVQSFTFINPTGEALQYLLSPSHFNLITFGIIALAGVLVGSFLYAVIARTFRIEWFASFPDFIRHVIGGVLMGTGGVLDMGCTIGQGVTGVSTLAIGSIMTLISIVFGSALTMKIQYYKLVYESKASFGAALLSALVDMRLLPRGLRKLEAV